MSALAREIIRGIVECSIYLFVCAWCYIPIYMFDCCIEPFLLEYHLLKWLKIILLGIFIIVYTLVVVKLIMFFYNKIKRTGEGCKVEEDGKEFENTVPYALENVMINKVNDTKMTDLIKRLSMKYQDVDSIYFNNGDEKSNEKIRKAIHYYAYNVNPQEVIVCFDDTVFGKANQGFLLTDSGLYIKYSNQSLNIIPWGKITGISFRSSRINDSIDIVVESIVVNICAEYVLKKDTMKIMKIIMEVFDDYQKSNK